MPNRSGPFWDGIEGRAPVPRVAATLGFQFISADVDNGAIDVAFEATEDFTANDMDTAIRLAKTCPQLAPGVR